MDFVTNPVDDRAIFAFAAHVTRLSWWSKRDLTISDKISSLYPLIRPSISKSDRNARSAELSPPAVDLGSDGATLGLL